MRACLTSLQNHFECLDPDDDQIGAKIYDYPDLFREAANALRMKRFFHEALRYYEPVQQISDYADASYFMEMASCYKATGLRTEAEDCYKIVVDSDKGNPEARRRLLEMCEESGTSPIGALNFDEAVSVRQRKARKRVGNKDAKQPRKNEALQSWATTMLAPRLVPQSAKRTSLDKEEAQEEDVNALFLRRETLTEQSRNGDETTKTEWMAVTKTLIQGFKDNKIFYPFDRHHKFYGYSKEARSLAARPKHELDALAEQSKSHLGMFENYRCITLHRLISHFRNSTGRSYRHSHGVLRNTVLPLARNLLRVCLNACTGRKHSIFIRDHRWRFPC